MRLALILGMTALIAWMAIGQWPTPQGLIEDTTVVPAQAVTNPRGEARTKLRVTPCLTIDPAPIQLEDHA